MLEVPFKVIKDGGYFTRGEIISNETLHYIEAKERWEIQLLKKLEPYCDTKKQKSLIENTYGYSWKKKDGQRMTAVKTSLQGSLIGVLNGD